MADASRPLGQLFSLCSCTDGQLEALEPIWFLSVNNSCCPLAMYSAHFTYHLRTALRGSDFGGGKKKKKSEKKKK